MPSIRMVVTDESDLIADKTVSFTLTEWDLLKESLKGWKATQIANPDYDPEGPEDLAENPPTIDVAPRWNTIDQVESWFNRNIGAVIRRQEKEKAEVQAETLAAQSTENKVITEAGDDVPVRVE